jgi:hypothetical protein
MNPRALTDKLLDKRSLLAVQQVIFAFDAASAESRMQIGH